MGSFGRYLIPISEEDKETDLAKNSRGKIRVPYEASQENLRETVKTMGQKMAAISEK
jgi:hypothetical protein